MSSFGRFFILLIGLLVAISGVRYLVYERSIQPDIEGKDDGSLYNPVRAREQLPDGYRQSLARDAILPIYEPTFVVASAAGWSDDTLVVGLAIDGDARAYPISHLNRREIVNDHVGNTPVLVTW